MDLPFKPYFAIACSCRTACASSFSFTPKQLEEAEKDPVIALRMLPTTDQRALSLFFAEHQRLGHAPEPRLVALAPLPTT